MTYSSLDQGMTGVWVWVLVGFPAARFRTPLYKVRQVVLIDKRGL